jgi:hypothetical protein
MHTEENACRHVKWPLEMFNLKENWYAKQDAKTLKLVWLDNSSEKQLM